MARVVDFRTSPYDVYIGRPSPWGNPIHLARDTLQERRRVIRAYAEYLLEHPALIEEARQTLKGKVLGCWCAPRICHGDVLVGVVDAEDPYVFLQQYLKGLQDEASPTEAPPSLF